MCILCNPTANRSIGKAGLQAASAVVVSNIDGQARLMLAGSGDGRNLRCVALTVDSCVVVVELRLTGVGTVAADRTNLDSVFELLALTIVV